MNQFAFSPDELYKATDNGLNIIKLYCHGMYNFHKAVQNKKEAFKYRDTEKTASSYLFQGDDDIWFIKDWGNKSYSPISVCMDQTGLAFFPALKYLYDYFGLSEKSTFFKPEIEVKECDKKEKRPAGWFEIKFAEKNTHLDIVGQHVTNEIANYYHFKQIESYEKVFIGKNGNLQYIKITATETYPIFGYQPEETWCKLYAPMDKKYKHSYLGTKPERFIHGFQQILDKVDTLEIDRLTDKINEYKEEDNDKSKNELIKERYALMLDQVIICTGGSDGLNVASLGYDCIWYNSEAEKINYSEYNELKKYCKQIYNLPDIDEAGLKYGHEVAEMHWELKTIWLPAAQMVKNGKDFRDYIKFYHSAKLETIQFQFKNLLTGALRFKFFDKYWSAKQIKYKLRIEFLLYFLNCKGFYSYKIEQKNLDNVASEILIFVKVEGNVVTKVSPRQIREYVKQYCREKGQPVELVETISTSTLFNENYLQNLQSREFDFKRHSRTHQAFFFKNRIANITAEGVELVKHGSFKNYVWNYSVHDHDIMPEAPFFEVIKDDLGHKINVLRNDCEYFNFLHNTSRMHWKKEYDAEKEKNPKGVDDYFAKNRFNIASEHLTEAEKREQNSHLLNKCYVLGYLLHRQKFDSFSKMVTITDDRPKSDEDDSNGRSGKSLMIKGLSKLLVNRFVIPGKNKNIENDKHILQGLTKHNDFILIEDATANFDLEWCFNLTTDSIVVNPKQNAPYEIEFEDLPKPVFITNYGLRKTTGSIMGRLMRCSFSDYYHAAGDIYAEEKNVRDDFDQNDLFSTYDEKQWNRHFHFLMQCCQLYLQYRFEEMKAPENNMNLNNLDATIGMPFKNWVENYLREDYHDEALNETIPGTLNNYVFRREAYEDYKKGIGSNYVQTVNTWYKNLKKYCESKGYIFNPKELLHADGKIKKPYTHANGKRDVLECFFIRTTPEIKPETIAEKVLTQQHFVDFEDDIKTDEIEH